MSKIGRNEPCPCGSGRKAKRCCGIPRGPAEAELAKSFVFSQARMAIVVDPPDEDEFETLCVDMLDLPSQDISLLMPLPRLVTPKLERLGEMIQAEDHDALEEELPALVSEFDTWPVRARLARVILNLREHGRLESKLAAVALADLASTSTALLESSLLHAVALSSGAARTPTGIVIAR